MAGGGVREVLGEEEKVVKSLRPVGQVFLNYWLPEEPWVCWKCFGTPGVWAQGEFAEPTTRLLDTHTPRRSAPRG